MKMNKLPDRKLLDALFTYDEEAGQLIWRVNRGGHAYPGLLAGRLDGYNIRVKVNGVRYIMARLIWLMYWNEDPGSLQIDHIDRNRLNNRIDNLRVVTQHENQRNVGLRKDNKTNIKGVQFRKDTAKWRATIYSMTGREQLYNGPDFFEACCARKSAEKRYGYGEL